MILNLLLLLRNRVGLDRTRVRGAAPFLAKSFIILFSEERAFDVPLVFSFDVRVNLFFLLGFTVHEELEIFA